MKTFKDAIEKKNVDYNKGYVCNICNMTKYSKPFVNYKVNDDIKIFVDMVVVKKCMKLIMNFGQKS